MINNYYILRSLTREWEECLTGAILEEAYSQIRGELSLTLKQKEYCTLQFRTRLPFLGAFRKSGYSRASRNVIRLFSTASGHRIVALRLAMRDRILTFFLDDGLQVQACLFGARANVFLADDTGIILEAFRNNEAWRGRVLPAPRSAPLVESIETFRTRWKPDNKNLVQTITRALPLFDRTLARETIHRAGISRVETDRDLQQLFMAVDTLRQDLDSPSPSIYWQKERQGQLSIVPLHHMANAEREPFTTVDEALRIFMQRSFGYWQLCQERAPLEKALVRLLDHTTRRLARIRAELARESRAERYEHRGHLLMAHPGAPRADRIILPDIFTDNRPVDISLDPTLSIIANAERYYEKARRSRQSRRHLSRQVPTMEARIEELSSLLERLRAASTLTRMRAFRKKEASILATIVPAARSTEPLPFRRFTLEDGGYTVWVGRNARESDVLTLQHARPYDLWMHARGVTGAHVVLRLRGRTDTPSKSVIERAAAIAAYFSKARGSSLVPVIVTPRKYVRKPKRAAPGAVMVEREEVLMVQPALPTIKQPKHAL